jgi:hypothetical protein
MVSGSYDSIQEIASIGKRLLGPTAAYVKKPDGSAILLKTDRRPSRLA